MKREHVPDFGGLSNLVHETSYVILISWKTQREMQKIYGMYLKEKLALGSKNNMDQRSKANFSCKGPGSEYSRLCGPHWSLSHTPIIFLNASIKSAKNILSLGPYENWPRFVDLCLRWEYLSGMAPAALNAHVPQGTPSSVSIQKFRPPCSPSEGQGSCGSYFGHMPHSTD